MQANQHSSLASPPSVSLVRTYTPSNAIDLTQEDDGPEPSRQIKRPRIDHNIDLTSPINSPPHSTSSLVHFSAHNEPVFSKPLVTDSRATSFSSRPIQSREAFTPFCNTSIATNSKPNLQTTTSLNPNLLEWVEEFKARWKIDHIREPIQQVALAVDTLMGNFTEMVDREVDMNAKNCQ